MMGSFFQGSPAALSLAAALGANTALHLFQYPDTIVHVVLFPRGKPYRGSMVAVEKRKGLKRKSRRNCGAILRNWSGKPGFWCFAPKMRPKKEDKNSYGSILPRRGSRKGVSGKRCLIYSGEFYREGFLLQGAREIPSSIRCFP
jgi:hypothetical protein